MVIKKVEVPEQQIIPRKSESADFAKNDSPREEDKPSILKSLVNHFSPQNKKINTSNNGLITYKADKKKRKLIRSKKNKKKKDGMIFFSGGKDVIKDGDVVIFKKGTDPLSVKTIGKCDLGHEDYPHPYLKSMGADDNSRDTLESLNFSITIRLKIPGPEKIERFQNLSAMVIGDMNVNSPNL